MASEHKSDPELTPDLLGYHLGLVDAEERARIEASFDSPEALWAACDALQRRLSPLDDDRIDPPSASLVKDILDRVEEARHTLQFPKLASALPGGAERGTASGPLIPLRELVGLAAAILIFLGIFIPGYQTARRQARLASCANNLRLIGNGQAGYAEMNANHLPFVGSAPKGLAWDQPSVRYSRHGYALVHGRYVPAPAFHCAEAAGDVPFDPDNPEDYDDFPEPNQNSYSANLAIRPLKWGAIRLDTPLTADMTPLVGRNRLLIRGRAIPPNSPNHFSLAGQNLLRLDMSVRFFATPNVGPEGDDIYRLAGVREYTGLERPQSRSDAFLIP